MKTRCLGVGAMSEPKGIRKHLVGRQGLGILVEVTKLGLELEWTIIQ